MMGAAAGTGTKKRGSPINLDFLGAFVHNSPDPGPGGTDEVRWASSPSPAARMGKAAARVSPGCCLDVYAVSPPSAPAKGKGKRTREEAGMSDDGLRRDMADMSDGELQQEIAGINTFGRLLTAEKRERNRRLLPLLEKEARRRRGIHRTDAAKDGGGDRDQDARSKADKVYTFDIEDELTEDDSRKYHPKSSLIRPVKKNYGPLGVQTRSSNQTGPRKTITVDKMYSSKTSPTPLRGHTLRVRAVDPKECDDKKSRQKESNYFSNFSKRRKAHHEDLSLLHQKVNDLVLLDDEDVQPDEPVDEAVLEKWKELKIYYPSSDDPEAVELSSSDIRCLNPGVYLSSPVINYYIQYIKRAEMHIEYGIDKFHMFNTYFYSKLQEALLDKSKFLRLRRWWKGVNIFQRGYLILPIHGTSHWSLIIVCIPAKESNAGPIILHLDSLGMHPSAEIFDTVGRYLEEEWCHLRKNPPSDISISDTIWQDLPRNIREEKVEVPGQNNAYDCGIFMLHYIGQFIKEAPERFTSNSLDMFSRNWFRSEVTSDLRKKIRELLLGLFENARVDDVLSEAAAPDGSNEDCVIKEGESEAVTPCDSSEMAVGGGDTSKHDEEDFMEVEGGDSSKRDEEDFVEVRGGDTSKRDEEDFMEVRGGDTSKRDEAEDFMEVRSLGGTSPTTRRSDGRIGDCALSEAATLSDSLKEDDDTRIGDCALSEAATLSDSLKEDDDTRIGDCALSEAATLSDSLKDDDDTRIGDCGLSEAAKLSDRLKDDNNDTMKTDSDSSKTEQDIEILASDSSKTEQDIEILPSGSSKNNEEVIHRVPGPDYCDDSCDSDVEVIDHRSWRAKKMQICQIS